MRSAMHRSHNTSVAAVLLLLLLLACYELPGVRAGWFRYHFEPASWCIVHPGCKVSMYAQEVADRKKLNLVPFYQQPPALHWLNMTTVRNCKYLMHCTDEAKHVEGIGAQYRRAIRVLAWTHKFNVSYVAAPLWMGLALQQLDGTALNDFLNLGDGELPLDALPDGSTVCLAEWCGAEVYPEFKPELHNKLRHGSVSSTPPLQGYSWNTVIVSVHIRRGEAWFSDNAVGGSWFLEDEYYIQTIRNISRDLSTAGGGMGHEFHIHCDSAGSELQGVVQALAGYPLAWRFAEPPMETLRAMMCSDVLVMTYSSVDIMVSDWYSSAIAVPPGVGWWPAAHPAARHLDQTLAWLRQRVTGRTYEDCFTTMMDAVPPPA